jgi:hypothetical protein
VIFSKQSTTASARNLSINGEGAAATTISHVNISFNDLSLSVTDDINNQKKKFLLNSVSGM